MPTEQTQTKRKYRTHPFSERKRVVELHESGLGNKQIASEMDLDVNMVRCWIRLYRAEGLEALRPHYGVGKGGRPLGIRGVRREKNGRLFLPALKVYSTTLEPVASITRRYDLDYQQFVYHLRRYHPELIAQRRRLQSAIVGGHPLAIPHEVEEIS